MFTVNLQISFRPCLTLANEIYTGNMVQGKYGSVSYKSKQNRPRPKSRWYRVEGTHEAIIDRGLWDRVQAMIAQRAKPFGTGKIGLFARKVRCAGCGYAMRSSQNRGRHYLQCATRHVSKEACAGAFISVEKLEQIVIDELKRISAEYLDIEELERKVELSGGLEAQKTRLLEMQTACRKKADDCTGCLRELYLDKVKGIISEADFIDMSREFSAGKKQSESRIAAINTQLEELESRIAAGDSRRALIEQYINPEHLNREMVEALIDYIAVGKRLPGEKAPQVEIHWNF